MKGRYEVHEHCFVRVSRANGCAYRLVHSHEGGSEPHQHPETGPASYTIDKDEWRRATCLRGGGRKRFTRQPEGEQFPRVELEDWQRTCKVIGAPPVEPGTVVAAGAAVDRMRQQFRMVADVEVQP